MRRASSLICAILVLATCDVASADTHAKGVGRAHRPAHAKRDGPPNGDEKVAGLGDGDLTPVPFQTAYIGDFDGKRLMTTVPGGATFREAHLIMEMLHDSGLVQSLDVVELNPFLDERGRSARVLVELVASLFGRRILDRPTLPVEAAPIEPAGRG